MKPNHGETLENYRQARKLGRRYVSEKHSQGESGFLPLLEESPRELAHEIGLGLFEIPLKKIRGTYSAGRQSALAGNFMPLLAEDSEFSGKWRSVLSAHLDEGLRDPIQVYEYLGWYYVREGNKRVSVLNFLGAYSYAANVTRLLPPSNSPDESVRVFYELAGPDKRQPIRHMWFSRYGPYTKLLEQAGEAVSGAGDDKEKEELLRESFRRFRQAYHASGCTDLPLTTGDAFFEYVQIYGFPLETQEKVLIHNIKNCEPMYAATDADAQPVLSDPEDMGTRFRLSLLPKSQRLSVAFAYAGKPPGFWSSMHDTGRFRLEREYPQIRVHRFSIERDASDAYEALSEAVVETKPDLLFVTDRRMEPAALRVALEQRGTLVLQCAAGTGRRALSTYYGNTADSAFLCGVIAGALTVGARLGFVQGRQTTGVQPQDVQAYAQGACTVRPKAHILHRTLTTHTVEARFEACAALAEAGCDIVLLPILPDEPLEYKYFPGAYAQLCWLSGNGRPLRRLAIAAWHWDVFYASLMQKIMEEGTDFSGKEFPLRFRMGLGSGLVDTHLVYPLVSPWIVKLYTQFRNLLIHGEIRPVDEEMAVEIEDS